MINKNWLPNLVLGRSVFWELENQFPIGWLVLDYLCDAIYLLGRSQTKLVKGARLLSSNTGCYSDVLPSLGTSATCCEMVTKKFALEFRVNNICRTETEFLNF
jgi:hypothetical protein